MSHELVAQDVSLAFGGIRAVEGASLTARSGELVGLIGPNGAGKTTLFEVLSGFIRPQQGHIHLDGVDLTELPAHRRARVGLGRGFQDARLYPGMSVEDTLKLALDRHIGNRVDMIGMLLGLPSAQRAEAWLEQRSQDLIDQFNLARYRDALIAELSTGTRRVVEIAALFGQAPDVILLDEPSSGIAQKETEELRLMLHRLRERLDIAIVLIEHDIPMVMDLSDRVYVMDAGRVIFEGSPEAVARDARVHEAYFGRRGAQRLAHA